MLPWPCILPGIRVSKIPGVVQGLSAVATGVRLLPLSITLLQAAVGVPKIFLTGIQDNPDVPKDVAAQAQVELTGGIPFLSDKDLRTQLDKAGIPPRPPTRSWRKTPTPASPGCARHCRCSPSSP